MAKKILVIEDDPTMQALLKIALQKGGYVPFAAMDAMQGPMMARQIMPDAIILDLMMPAGGGGSVYDRLRQMTQFMMTPILVYTAKTPEDAQASVAENEFTAILHKPAPPSAVLEALSKLLAPKD